MLAATAAADITPAPGQLLQGHWSTKPSHSVLYPLEVRSIVFAEGDERAAIATLDVIGVTLDTTNRIRNNVEKLCGIPGAAVMVACSHTHCGPATLGCLGMTPDGAYMRRLEEAVVQSIVDAADRLEPVTLGLGAGSAHFNVNRRPMPGRQNMSPNEAGIVDRRVRVLRLDRLEGAVDEPLAVLFHYSCHPVTMVGSDGYISPDYPGLARSGIESRLGGHALFLPGCFGNVRPRIVREGQFGSATKEELDKIGEQLAVAATRAAHSVRTRPSEGLWTRLVEIHMPFGPTHDVDELKEMAADESSESAVKLRGPWAKRVLEMIEQDAVPAGLTSQMQAMRIGPLLCVTIPGEPVQEIGHAIERQLLGTFDAHDIWSVGYANDMLGYLCTERQHNEGGYEPNAYPNFGQPAPFDRAQQTILAGAQAVCEHVGVCDCPQAPQRPPTCTLTH